MSQAKTVELGEKASILACPYCRAKGFQAKRQLRSHIARKHFYDVWMDWMRMYKGLRDKLRSLHTYCPFCDRADFEDVDELKEHIAIKHFYELVGYLKPRLI